MKSRHGRRLSLSWRPVWSSPKWDRAHLRRRLCAAITLAWVCASSMAAQAPARMATTVEAVMSDVVFFHGRQIAVRGAVAQTGTLTRLVVGDTIGATASPKTHPIFVFFRQAPASAQGEVRGEFWDLGRLREGDPRFSAYDFRPLLEAASGGRWPGRDEVFVILGAAIVESPEPSAPSLRSIVLAPSRYADRGVIVAGRFRGRNLYGDVASALNRSRWDFVLQSADAALWVSGIRPRGNGFDLDPGAKVDTGRWLQVSGTVRTEGSRVWIDGESLQLSAPPSDTAPEQVPAPVIKEGPPAVIFTAPVADETDVAGAGTVRVQFSRDMDGRTFRGRVRVVYVVTAPEPPPPLPVFTATYRDGNRAVEIKFATPLARFQTVRVELLEGIAAFDGQGLPPWSMTFSTGAR